VAAPSLPFAREEGDRLVTSWARVEVMVPDSFFQDPPLADDLGGRVETLAFVDVRAREREGDPPRYFALRLPARMQFSYSSSADEYDGEGDKLRVFTSVAGEIFVADVNVVQSSDSVSEIFRALAGARISGAGYTDLAQLFIEGAKINGTGTGVTRSLMEALVSEMARWTSDPTVPLRIPLVAGRATAEDFRFAKLKELPRLNSVFTGIGFEDIQLSVQAAVRKSMSGEAQRTSPMEDLVRY
jgi:hypothetical protein